ncbi:hypothetical protein COL922a_011654 [Colletotrichum nupharicola]|nr:hypothetical protein COL922a_011654 [Colletotrichum nupharicola]
MPGFCLSLRSEQAPTISGRDAPPKTASMLSPMRPVVDGRRYSPPSTSSRTTTDTTMARDDANHVVRLNLVKLYPTDDADLECLEAAVDNRFSLVSKEDAQESRVSRQSNRNILKPKLQSRFWARTGRGQQVQKEHSEDA